jgi:hypothetical protein
MEKVNQVAKLLETAMSVTSDKALIGIAGTHLVCYELVRRGYIASMTSRNTQGIDVLASTKDGRKTASIQVKTRSESSHKDDWILSEKDEDRKSEFFYYVFVHLRAEEEKTEFYIVPSKLVAQEISKYHVEWRNAPGRGGRRHQDTTMRKFFLKYLDDTSKYKDNWHMMFDSKIKT